MVGMLAAIPKTPLYARLQAEGRLDFDDEPAFGTNVVPLGMSRDELRDGYIEVMRDLYEPAAYFDRLDSLYLEGRFRVGEGAREYWRRHPATYLRAQSKNLVRCAGLFTQLMRQVPEARLRAEYRRRMVRLMRARWDPAVWFVYLIKSAMHYHHYTLSRQMTAPAATVVNSF